jgi:hypothetical protein
MARSISFSLAGKATHSSSCIWMSESSRPCISIERSGDISWVAPSIWERKVTPFSLSFLSCASDITWNPPLSVRIGCGQRANSCKPPSRATRSAPGRSIK